MSIVYAVSAEMYNHFVDKQLSISQNSYFSALSISLQSRKSICSQTVVTYSFNGHATDLYL